MAIRLRVRCQTVNVAPRLHPIDESLQTPRESRPRNRFRRPIGTRYLISCILTDHLPCQIVGSAWPDLRRYVAQRSRGVQRAGEHAPSFEPTESPMREPVRRQPVPLQYANGRQCSRVTNRPIGGSALRIGRRGRPARTRVLAFHPRARTAAPSLASQRRSLAMARRVPQ